MKISLLDHDDNSTSVSDEYGPRVSELSEVANSRLITGWVIAGIVWLLGCILYLRFIQQHKKSIVYGSKTTRGYGSVKSIELTVSIIWLAPVYMTTSYFSLFFFRVEPLMELARAAYEAFVLLYFMQLIRELMGEDHQAEALLQSAPLERIYAAPPACCCCICLPERRLSLSTFNYLSYGVKQLAVVRPVVTLVMVIMALNQSNFQDGVVAESSGYIYLDTLNMISLFLCLYCLFIIYKGVKKVMPDHSIGTKFAAIKVGLICAIVQKYLTSIVISATDNSDDSGMMPAHVRATAWNNFLLVFEFFALYWLFVKAYPVYSADEARDREASKSNSGNNNSYNPPVVTENYQIMMN